MSCEKDKYCKDLTLRYYYGERYYTVTESRVIPTKNCGDDTELVIFEDAVEYAPDTFGMMHLQGNGVQKVAMRDIRVTMAPYIKNGLGEMATELFISPAAIFRFQNSDIRYKVKHVKGLFAGRVIFSFFRLDKNDITEEEIELVKTSKYIRIINGV